jgi:hypothetical protein
MAHYAFLDEDNVVTEVIVGRNEGEEGIDWEAFYASERNLPASKCRRTSYNTVKGVHVLGGEPYRNNYAGLGYSFDPNWGSEGAFFPPESPSPVI